MKISGLYTGLITTDEILRLENITRLTLKNYGTTEMVVTHMGVPEKIPAYDAVNKYAESWELPADDTITEKLELLITFTSQKGNAILRYKHIKIC